MILYHFTTRNAVEPILQSGILEGEAPLSDHRIARAVNLTTDPNPMGHGLDHGGHVIDHAAAARYAAKGFDIPAGTIFADKLEVRITVVLPSSSRLLKQWRPWARRHCDPGYDRALEAAAGPACKARTWWLYFGIVPPEAIRSVEVLKP